MRTDATIDKQQVRCPNASHLGFDKWKAQVGDLVLFKEGEQIRLARMVGRIHYAPQLEGDRGPIHDWILGAVLDEMLAYVGERWIDPENVVRVQAIRGQKETMEWFLSDEMVREDVGKVRLCISELWSSWKAFQKWFAESRGGGVTAK